MKFLHRQIPFVSSLKKKAIVAFAMGSFLSFVIIFLEPFDTNNYTSDFRELALLGFGAVLFASLFIQSIIENIWYNKANKVWLISHEIVSVIAFILISGSFVFLYNHKVVRSDSYSLSSHWLYFKHFVSVMIPVIAPLLVYLRQRLGTRIIPIPPSTVTIHGRNKHETLQLKKGELLYIKAVENYIEICYVGTDKNLLSVTFRQTLSHVHQQASFLEKCHRSYLVNLENIHSIQGNSQRAKISFKHTQAQIPLSKVLYKSVKTRLAEIAE